MVQLYHALDPALREIRLLRAQSVTSSHEQDDSNEHGSPDYDLAVFSLNDVPRYKALSYCWSQDKADKRININEAPFLVRPNLHGFLQILHEETLQDLANDDVGWTFVDAVCINQQDLDERSSQVTIMGDIYRQATEVVVWLGNEGDPMNDYSKLTMVVHAFHKDLNEWQNIFDLIHFAVAHDAAKRIVGDRSTNYLDTALETYGEVMVQALVIPAGDDSGLYSHILVEDIASALDCPLRIAQIWVVSSNSDRRVCKSTSFDRPKHDIGKEERYPVEAAMFLQEKIKFGDSARKHQMALSSAVTSFVGRRSSDMRDQVYGLIGMTESKVPINYSIEDTVGLYGQALVEGLLEIAYRHSDGSSKPGQQSAESAEYTVSLAKALGQNLHDRFGVCYHMTKYCCELNGVPFRPVSELWVRVQRLEVSTFLKFGRMGRKLYKKMPRLLHNTTTLNAKFYGSDKDLERILKKQRDSLMILRCFPRWRFKQLMLTIPELSIMTNNKLAEDVIKMIEDFPGTEESVQLAEEAIKHLHSHLLTLENSEDRLSQDHAIRLQGYVEKLQLVLSRQLETPDIEPYNRNLVPADDGKQKQQDLRSIIQFLVNSRFGKKVPDYFIGHSNVNQMVQTFEIRRFELSLYTALQDNLATSRDVRDFMESRMRDWDFREFVRRAREMQEVDSSTGEN